MLEGFSYQSLKSAARREGQAEAARRRISRGNRASFFMIGDKKGNG
jgi:hypothetical protein